MKKRLAMFVVLALTCTMLGACGSKEAATTTNEKKETEATSEPTDDNKDGDKKEATTEPKASKEAATIAFICKDLSQEWFVGTSTAMNEAIKARGGNEMLTFDCGMSPDKYMTALDNVISQGVDVLIVCPPDQNLSQITAQRCEEAGIKVMADDDGLIDESGKHLAPALELDAYKVGQGIGDYLGQYVKDNQLEADFSKVGYICMTMSEVSSCVPRSEGAVDNFKASVPDFPEDKILTADYDGTSDKGFNVAAAVITANPDIETWLVTAPNDEGAQGATRALEQAGKDKEAIVIGVGGYLAKDEFKKDFSCFKATAYIDPILDGQIAGDAAMDWYEKDIVPYADYPEEGGSFGVYPFSATMVDVDNYQEVMGDSAN